MPPPIITPPSDETVSTGLDFVRNFAGPAIAFFGGVLGALTTLYMSARRSGERDALLSAQIEALQAGQKASEARADAAEHKMEAFKEELHAFKNSIAAAMAEKPSTIQVERLIDRLGTDVKERVDWLREDIRNRGILPRDRGGES
jgi:hypothetical protein